MPVQAIIFDLDGTLLDTLEDIGDASNRALARHGFPTHPAGDYREFIGEGVARLVARALPEQHRHEATIRSCAAAFREEYERNWDAKTRPYAGVPEMLDALAARQLRLAVLSNKPDEFTQMSVRKLLARWSFEVVLGASDALPRKPDPAGALEIARRLKVPPADIVYVGDSGVDMQTARAARMFAVGVLWGFRARDELLRGCAQTVIEHPGQLLSLLGGSQPNRTFD